MVMGLTKIAYLCPSLEIFHILFLPCFSRNLCGFVDLKWAKIENDRKNAHKMGFSEKSGENWGLYLNIDSYDLSIAHQ